jgi:hypothetical protein
MRFKMKLKNSKMMHPECMKNAKNGENRLAKPCKPNSPVQG